MAAADLAHRALAARRAVAAKDERAYEKVGWAFCMSSRRFAIKLDFHVGPYDSGSVCASSCWTFCKSGFRSCCKISHRIFWFIPK